MAFSVFTNPSVVAVFLCVLSGLCGESVAVFLGGESVRALR
jgi:hypothetical protein